jgi:hypothetical protein
VVLTGSETTRNSSGRTDLTIKHGGPFRLGGQFVSNSIYRAIDAQGSSGNEIRISGSMPRGTSLGYFEDCFRGITSSNQNGTITWGEDNGWAYRGAICPNTPGTTPRYGSISASSTTSITYQCNASVDHVDIFVYRGGFIL